MFIQMEAGVSTAFLQYFIDVLGNAFCVLLQQTYLYLLHYVIVHAHKQIHETDSFENGNSPLSSWL